MLPLETLHATLKRALKALEHEPKYRNQWTGSEFVDRSAARHELRGVIANIEQEMLKADACERCGSPWCECKPCPVFTWAPPLGHGRSCGICGFGFHDHSPQF